MGGRVIVRSRQSLFLGKRASCIHKGEWLDKRLRKRIAAFLPRIRPYPDHPHLTDYAHFSTFLPEANCSKEMKYHDSLLLYSCTVLRFQSTVLSLFLILNSSAPNDTQAVTSTAVTKSRTGVCLFASENRIRVSLRLQQSELIIVACAKINCITANEVKRETQSTMVSTKTRSGNTV
jgi:hypothetical protein